MSESMMQRYDQQVDAFVDYVHQFPDLTASVMADLVLLDAALAVLADGEQDSVLCLALAREASMRVRDVAQEAGFAEVAGFFQGVYESVCGELAKLGVR